MSRIIRHRVPGYSLALLSQGDAGDGSITITRSEGVSGVDIDPGKTVTEAYEINLTTAGNDTFTHKVVEYDDGSSERQIVTPDGTTSFETGSDLTEGGTVPFGGGEFTRIRRAGAVLGLTTPLPFRLGSLKADYQVGDGSFREDLSATVGFTQTTERPRILGKVKALRMSKLLDTVAFYSAFVLAAYFGAGFVLALGSMIGVSVPAGSSGPWFARFHKVFLWAAMLALVGVIFLYLVDLRSIRDASTESFDPDGRWRRRLTTWSFAAALPYYFYVVRPACSARRGAAQ